MAAISYQNSSTTVTIAGTTIRDLIQGDWLEIGVPNMRSERVNAEGGGVSVHERIDADEGTLRISVQRFSDSDSFLSSLSRDNTRLVFGGTAVTTFERDGETLKDSWTFVNMSVTEQPDHLRNNETDPNSVDYNFKFRSHTRVL